MTVDDIALALTRLRAAKPLVHCLTNQVVKGFTANVLLAIGAAPAMVEDPEEAEEFAAIASALLINVGTLEQTQMTAMRRAIASANKSEKPWVLDPVAIGALTLRTQFVHEIVPAKPAIIRGNASEILTLAGQDGGGRGPESSADSGSARAAAKRLAGQTGSVVLVTGKIDYIASPTDAVAVDNGHEMLTRVTGVGCAMGAIAAAFLGAGEHPFVAAGATSAVLGIAGEFAAARTRGPGSFAIALLDYLNVVDEAMIRKHIVLTRKRSA